LKIPLTEGAYEARSAIADAQKCVNLYIEKNPEDSPFPATHYPTPGTPILTTAPVMGEVRASYAASNGNLYVVVADTVYYVSPAYVWTSLGTLTTNTGFVSVKDNTFAVVFVDGTAFAFCANLADNSWNAVSGTNFYATSMVDYIDGFLLFTVVGTNQFFFTLENATFAMLVGGLAFDPLDIAGKNGGNDNLIGLKVMHREIWLIGAETSEVWYDAGAADFAFQAMPGAFVEHGCTAVGSIAKYDLSVYWLGQDAGGANVVFEGAQYRVKQISTKPIDRELATYTNPQAALGFTYLQEGHVFYVLTFPEDDVTWVYDIGEQRWHKRAWTGPEGELHRWRPNCFSAYNGLLVCGDFANGNLYTLDLDTYLDQWDGTTGDPIVRVRSFPHVTNENKRLVHRNLIAAMEVGNEMTGATNDNDYVSLRWSDNAGRSYGNAVLQPLGPEGFYQGSVQWNRLGLARDRVYEMSWSAPVKTSIQGVYLDVVESAS